MNRRQRRELRLERVEGQRRHPRSYTTRELRTMLVEDAAAGFGPGSQPGDVANGMAYLAWVTSAIQIIAAKERKTVDAVFCEVRDQATSRNGYGMPL